MYYPVQKKHTDSSAFFKLKNIPTVQHKIAEPWSETVGILLGDCHSTGRADKTHVCLRLSLCDQLAWQTNSYNAKAVIFWYPQSQPIFSVIRTFQKITPGYWRSQCSKEGNVVFFWWMTTDSFSLVMFVPCCLLLWDQLWQRRSGKEILWIFAYLFL